LPDAATRSRRGFNPPAVTLFFHKVTLAVPDTTNRQPAFVGYANHRHVGNFPHRPPLVKDLRRCAVAREEAAGEFAARHENCYGAENRGLSGKWLVVSG